MKSLQTHSRTTAQGVLNLALPIGLPNAEVDVILIVSESHTNGTARTTDRNAWNTFVDETAGAWEGEFVRPPQGEFEKREPFV